MRDFTRCTCDQSKYTCDQCGDKTYSDAREWIVVHLADGVRAGFGNALYYSHHFCRIACAIAYLHTLNTRRQGHK